jgi:CSLREA domain-containing protein
MTRPIHQLRFAFLLGVMVLFAAPGGVRAASITVDTTADELNGNGDCSLREAIQAANTDSAVSGCTAGSGADSITLPAGTYLLTRTGPGEDGNATGDLDVLGDVTITGAGGGLTVIDGNATDRVLHVITGVVVAEDIVFQRGHAPDGAPGNDCEGTSVLCNQSGGDGAEGGGILTQPGTSLTLRRVVVEDNEAGAGGQAGDINCLGGSNCETSGGDGGNGGGISGFGALTIVDSLILDNRAGAAGAAGAQTACGGSCFSFSGNGGDGGGVIIEAAALNLRTSTVAGNDSPDWAGGVYCHHNSACTIRDTTIADNTGVFRGGGLTVVGSATTATVENTTVTGNHAEGFGGGVALFSGTTTLRFVTIAGNSTGPSIFVAGGGGIDRTTFAGPLTIANTIIAGNTDSDGHPDCNGPIPSSGYNHVQDTTGCAFAATTGDVTGTNPLLAALADNGGPTDTRALASTSPAVDAIPEGTSGCGTTTAADQRGRPRPMDGDLSGSDACDKGAYELDGPTHCLSAPPTCEVAAKSNLLLKDASPDAGKDKLVWMFKGGATEITQAQLGDPTTEGTYNLCVYYGSTLVSEISLNDPAKWSALGTKGYKYKDKTGANSGITKVLLKGGAAGKTKVLFLGKGDNLPDLLPLGPVPPEVTVATRNSGSATCFSAVYPTAKKNEPDLFKALFKAP